QQTKHTIAVYQYNVNKYTTTKNDGTYTTRKRPKHKRNKRVSVSIAASLNRTDGLGSVVYRALCNPPGRFTGGLPRSGPIFRGWGTLARRRFAAKNRYRPSGLRIAVGCRIQAAPLPLLV